MLTFYARVQRPHRPDHVIKKGVPSRSYDCPERIDAILAALDKAGLGSILPPSEADTSAIARAHDPGMLAYLEQGFDHESAIEPATALFPTFFPPPGQRRRPERVYGQRGLYCTDMGAPITRHTWHAAQASAGAAAAAARHVLGGLPVAYALCRPPGHHAGPDFFGGYCYLNNAAIATHVLRSSGSKVAILDIDYHHGNGTQAFFETDPNVWYGSLHVNPAFDYPFFAGYADEKGLDEGAGTILNLPLDPDTEPEGYMRALDRLIEALADFSPQWLVVSAGFDTSLGDPVGGFGLTTGHYEAIGRAVGSLGLGTVVVQEGGYDLDTLGQSVVSFVSALGAM